MALLRRSSTSRRYRQLFLWALLLLVPRIAGADSCQLCGCASCEGSFPLGNPEAELTFTPEELTPTLMDAVQQVENLGIILNCAFLEQILQQQQQLVEHNNNTSSSCDALRQSSRVRTLCECPPLDAPGHPPADGETDSTPTPSTTLPNVRRASWDFILAIVLLGLAVVLCMVGISSRLLRWHSQRQPADPSSAASPTSSLTRWATHWRLQGRRRQQPTADDSPQMFQQSDDPSLLVPQSVLEQQDPHAYGRKEARDLEEAIYQSTLEAVIAHSKADMDHSLPTSANSP